MNICCTNHDMWHSIPQTGIKCVTEADEIKDLIKPGPLRVAYYNYCHYHGKLMRFAAAIFTAYFK